MNPEEIKKRIEELKPEENRLYSRGDDIADSRLFADVYRDYLRYNPTARQWYFWDGRIWRKDEGGLRAERCAKLLARGLLLYAADLDEDNYYRKHIVKFGSRNKRDTILKDARDKNPVSMEELDEDDDLFNCQNCVVNLRTLEVMEHRPEQLLSKISNVYYDKSATCEEFEKFLSEVMCGDIEKIDYIQRLLGYCLTGETNMEECYFFYGATTRNGKSTLIETFKYMLGGSSGYCLNVNPETLARMKDKDGSRPSGDIARLKGCRAAHVSEPPKRMLLNVELIKNLTGGDTVTARHLQERDFEFKPKFKIIFNTNYLPTVMDNSLFTSDRVKIIPFDRHFSKSEQDKTLKRRLCSRQNISGLFNWCLEGLQKYREAGDVLNTPDSIEAATERYRESSDKIGNFIREELVEDSSMNMAGSDAYMIYDHWCKEFGYGVENKQNFFDELRSRNLMISSGTIRGKTVRNVLRGYRQKFKAFEKAAENAAK